MDKRTSGRMFREWERNPYHKDYGVNEPYEYKWKEKTRLARRIAGHEGVPYLDVISRISGIIL